MKNKFLFPVLAMFLLMVSNFSLAGGLDSATTAATDFKTWLYAFIGVVSIIYLLVKAMMVKMQKATWGDFGTAVVWVAICGGIPVLASWAWSVWGGAGV